MVFTKLMKQAEQLVVENSAAILTGVGIVGTITTAVLAGKASYTIGKLSHHDHKDEIKSINGATSDDMTTFEKAKIIWPLYIPAVASGVSTVSAIFFSHQISTKKTAAMAAAYGISEKAFQEYKDKVVEKLGVKKDEAMRDAVAQDTVNANPVSDRTVIIVGGGDVLCYDAFTGRYFQSSIETIKKAENAVNHEILHHSYASLGCFYDELGLPVTELADALGWNGENMLDIAYSTTMSTDGRPCIVVDFRSAPITDYGKLY